VGGDFCEHRAKEEFLSVIEIVNASDDVIQRMRMENEAGVHMHE
jgi:hypothetical protein